VQIRIRYLRRMAATVPGWLQGLKKLKYFLPLFLVEGFISDEIWRQKWETWMGRNVSDSAEFRIRTL
jgi:hypothetical protein